MRDPDSESDGGRNDPDRAEQKVFGKRGGPRRGGHGTGRGNRGKNTYILHIMTLKSGKY